jgi:tetratricopeptide (TPR) repeat protein
LDEAFALASQAIATLGSRYPDDPMHMASLNNILGGICWQQGKLPEAITYVQRSLDLYEKLGYLWGMATAYGNLGILRYMEGNWLRAAEYYERAYTIHQTIGNPESQAHNLDNLGVLHTATGNYETAQRELSAGLTIRKRLGDVWGTAQSHLNLACLAIAQSRVAEAAEKATTALNLSESIGSTEIVIPARWCLALVRAEKADLEGGLQLAGQALDLARSTQFVEGQIDSLRVLGTIQSLSDNYGEARATLQESIRLAQTHHAAYRQGQALYASGRLYQRLAQVDPTAAEQWQTQALNAFNEAVHLFEALGAGHDLRLVQVALNQVHED